LTKPTKKNIGNFIYGDLLQISPDEALANEIILIDVRTAEEFEKGSIPKAQNFPIFDNLERSEIGTIYKNLGRNEAVIKGLEIFEPKLKNFLFLLSSKKSKKLVVYCSRGGMRSAAVVRMLQDNGFSVWQMHGGYKAYRKLVLNQLEVDLPKLIVLHGKTGVGKTLLLKRLSNHIDLEGLAEHRSSLFGAIHKNPSNQKNFEAKLVNKLKEISGSIPVFVEGESRKVGRVFIPEIIANAMKKGVFVLLSAPIEVRIKRILEEYQICDEKSVQQIDSILVSLRVSLGTPKVEKMRLWLKNGEMEKIVRMLLVEYYDPRYQNAMKKYKFSMKISTENLDYAAKMLTGFRNEIIEKCKSLQVL